MARVRAGPFVELRYCGLPGFLHAAGHATAAAGFAHAVELGAAQLAVPVRIGLGEAFAAALGDARLHVAAVDVAVLVDIHLVEAVAGLGVRGLRLGTADAAVLVGVRGAHATMATHAAAMAYAAHARTLVGAEPAVLVAVELVELLGELRHLRGLGAIDHAVLVGVERHARHAFGPRGRGLREGGRGRQGDRHRDGQEFRLLHVCSSGEPVVATGCHRERPAGNPVDNRAGAT